MVEENNNSASQPGATGENPATLENEEPVGGTVTAEAPKWITTNTEPMDAEEEANLAAFLEKVAGACKNDSSVPGFVGTQV